ncbi:MULTISPECIES: GNAT family protein [unclassified Clostridium]|uniref:GNAT family N-acetyltransferase n=1 Tax=unclassified Clostridium TaxID=2614128 RepID=UPI003217302B
MKSTYETERLVLTILDENDSDKVVDYVVRNREFFSQVEPQREDEFYTVDFQTEELRGDFKYIQDRIFLRLWVFNKGNYDKIVGQVTFYNIVPYAFLSCHIGYKSDKDVASKGIMTEAVKAGIKIMFEEYGMHRIEAYALPNNKASIRVLEKLGFIYEGMANKFLEVNGKWEDHLHYALINE